jgi:hypothetical protein
MNDEFLNPFQPLISPQRMQAGHHIISVARISIFKACKIDSQNSNDSLFCFKAATYLGGYNVGLFLSANNRYKIRHSTL